MQRLAVLLLGLAVLATACGSGQSGSGGSSSTKIALLLPETKTARYETQDRPSFERRVRELCPDCEMLYSNADQDATKQQSQAEAALTNGADVLVLDAVDFKSAASIVVRAKQSKVPVVSYSRLVLDADIDFYVSFDSERIGRLQAQALLDALKSAGKVNGTIVMINGAPTDNNATLLKQGAHSVLDGSGPKIGQEFDTPDWSPDKAQQQMEQALTNLGPDQIAGVYAANDGTAGGAIAAMKGAGVNPLPPVTGQDAELLAIQRILAGEQYMTVYMAIKLQAETAAELAVALAKGEQPRADLVTSTVNNNLKDVPSVLLTPIAVTKQNVKDTVIKDGFWTVDQVCTASFAAACKAAGLR
ncbi:MAG: ABC transporter substrate-binding protein [Egibacteraceae bacterium]